MTGTLIAARIGIAGVVAVAGTAVVTAGKDSVWSGPNQLWKWPTKMALIEPAYGASIAIKLARAVESP